MFSNFVDHVKTSFLIGSHSFLVESLDGEPDSKSEPSMQLSWKERREWFRARFAQRANLRITNDELRVHFSDMPQHYWDSVTEAELEWGLETVHGFLELVATP